MPITGRIYKITSAQTDKIYIGSTTEKLNRRYTGHKSDYKRYLNGNNKRKVSSFEILKYDDAKIELLEEGEYENKDEMHYKEREYIEKNKNCVNKYKPLLNDDERNNYDLYRCVCECGGSYVNSHKAQHKRTIKHINYITINIKDSEVKIINNGNDGV